MPAIYRIFLMAFVQLAIIIVNINHRACPGGFVPHGYEFLLLRPLPP